MSRPGRQPTPTGATEEIAVAAPPEPPRPARTGMASRLLPLAMAIVMIAMMAAFYRSGSSVAHSPTFLAFPVMMLVSVAVNAIGRSRWTGTDVDGDRTEYLNYLSAVRDRVTDAATTQRASLAWRHPDPELLWALSGGPRMWERRAADPDFGHVRVGRGPQPLATRLVPPQIGPEHRVDPVTATALRRFLHTHSMIDHAPIAVALPGLAAVTIDGDPDAARALVRAMICQLAMLHGPDHLLIAGISTAGTRDHWDWLKWLPHNQHPSVADGLGAARMLYPSLASAHSAFAGLLADRGSLHDQAPNGGALPHLVVVIDGAAIDGSERGFGSAGTSGVTVLEIGTSCDDVAAAAGLRVRIARGQLAAQQAGEEDICARPDQLTAIDALVCARRLAAYRRGRTHAASASPHWHDLLGIGDFAAFNPVSLWDSLSRRDQLRVPIGITSTGEPVELDIKEAADKGMGPHGLCIGATGSGKSEFLRTVALGMIARHSPEALNLVLVDFKGGATFLELGRAPQVSAVITNLSGEAALVARMHDALAGEMNRRQELLRAAGNVVNRTDYERARRAGAPLAALPELFIIVDEFSELLSQHPDFVEVFTAIGRLGRSLGMYLLLASQRLDEGRLRGLDSHLSYRVCLKTLSASESRIVLGTSDAYELPNTPGAGYLRTANAELIRFQTAFVSGPCPPGIIGESVGQGGQIPSAVQLFTAGPVGPIKDATTAQASAASGRSVLQAVLDRLAGHGPPAHQVWLPPLDASPALGSLLGEVAAGGELVVPIGLVDRPFEQQRTLLRVDLSAAAGNVALVGGPRSGKSTALRTLITALAATHHPRQVQVYCLDFGGGALLPLRALPHVGAVANRAQPELATRIIDELEAVMRSREAEFGRRGIDIAGYRQRDIDSAGDSFGDVFLVVDGWSALRHHHDALETSITAIAAQGLSLGVHVMLSAARWAEIRPALKDQIGTRIELRLGEPADSEVDRRQAQRVPAGKPGRGLSGEGLHMVMALPRLDGIPCASEPAGADEQIGELLRRRHGAAAAPPIRLLPEQVDHHSVIVQAGHGLDTRIVLGVKGRELAPATVDFEPGSHLLILGDNQCGKTNALRTLCREIVRTSTAAQAQLVVVDFRRALLGVVESGHLGAYAMSAAALDALLPDLVDLLQRRMPAPQVSPEQLRTGSWWSGPDIYVVVDDYDLVATTAGNRLTALLEYLPNARDLGLHLIVARRSGGAARTMFEPLLAELRDSGCMALVMSANRDEGPLIGSVRPAPLPPGRGTLITRAGGEQLMQVAWSAP